MSNYTKKGYTQIPRVQSDGTTRYIAVKIGGPTHRKYMAAYKKWGKERRAQNAAFKAEMKDAKRKMAARQKDRETAANQTVDF